MSKKLISQYEFKKAMDAILDEANRSFIERFNRDPSGAETYLRYLKDVLFLDADEHLALFKTYNSPFIDREPNIVEMTQDTPPTQYRLKRI